ncbi:MAG TPA: PilZ domain-containing protein [Nitrospirota bacterium]|nr:PilZ domain-containing protein [Nitrospirota bacterium]
MGLRSGDQINYRLMPDIDLYGATVLSVDEKTMELRTEADAPAIVKNGQYVMINELDSDIEHYSEVTFWDGRSLRLRRMWTGKRGFFRVDDVFPVTYRIVDVTERCTGSRIFPGFGLEADELDVPDETVSPRVWKMLVDINAKLEMILERLNKESEGLSRAQSVPVNISASGIRFFIDQPVEIGSMLELKMLLPLYPPVGVLAHGVVVRIEASVGGRYETSLCFIDLVDEVRDIIIQYTLKRQREIIRRQRD